MKKMIFIAEKLEYYNGLEPKVGDCVTVIQSQYFQHSYVVLEYPVNPSGYEQAFRKKHFTEPKTNALSKELAESFLEQDSKTKETHREKVFTTKANF